MNIEKTVNGIISNASASIKAEQGDYVVDGLLYCHKCHTPKQTRVMLFGKERTPMCLCKCAIEKRNKEEAERKRIEFEKRIKELRRAGFLDEELQNCTFANDDQGNEKATTVAKNYVANFQQLKEDGKGLLFFGTVGTGKTFIAACIANALIDKGIPCLVTNFARLVNTISATYEKQEYIDGLNRFTLLVIDDLASERNTEYMNEIVYNIIDSRYRAGLPLIITTNLTAEELKKPAEISKQRIYSRLLEMCLPVEVKGADRRRQKLKGDFKNYADLLGLNATERN